MNLFLHKFSAYGDDILRLEDLTTTTAAAITTTEQYSQGFIITTTNAPSQSTDCSHNDTTYSDGELVTTDQPCEHCYCMRGDIVCAVQECGTPLDMEGKNCTARPPRDGECCPDVYDCESKSDVSSPSADLPKSEEESAATIAPTVASIEIEPATTEGIDDSENEIHDKDDATEKPIIRESTDRVEEATTIRYEEPVTLVLSGDLGTRLSEGQTEVPQEDDVTTQAAEIEAATEENLIVKDEKPISESVPSQKVPEPTTSSSIDELPTTHLPPSVQLPSEDDVLLANIIPGEGDCLVDGISYANSSTVLPRNKCELSCACMNSVVQCEKVKCPPLPENAWKCKVSRNDEECCLSYICEELPTTEAPFVAEVPAVTGRIEEAGQTEKPAELPSQSTSLPAQDNVAVEQQTESDLASTELPEQVESTGRPIVPDLSLPADEISSQPPLESDAHRTESPAIQKESTEGDVSATESSATEKPLLSELPKGTVAPISLVQENIVKDNELGSIEGTTTTSGLEGSAEESEVSTKLPQGELYKTESPLGLSDTQVPEGTSTTAPELITKGPEQATQAAELPTEINEVITQGTETQQKSTELPAQASDSLTESPESLSQAPESLSEAPESLTQAPDWLPEAPESLTQAPDWLPEAPEVLTQAPEVVTAEQGLTNAPASATESQEQGEGDGLNKQSSLDEATQQAVTESKAQPATEAAVPEIELTTLKSDEILGLDNRLDDSTTPQAEELPVKKIEPIATSTEVERDFTTQRVEELPTIIEAVSFTQQQQLEGSTETVFTVTPSSGKIENKKVEEPATDSGIVEEQTTPQQVSIVLPESSSERQQPDVLDLIQQSTEQELAPTTDNEIVQQATEEQSFSTIAPAQLDIARPTVAPISVEQDQEKATESPFAEQEPSISLVPSSEEPQESAVNAEAPSPTTAAPLVEELEKPTQRPDAFEPEAEDKTKVSGNTEIPALVPTTIFSQQDVSTDQPRISIDLDLQTTEQPQEPAQKLTEAPEKGEVESSSILGDELSIVTQKESIATDRPSAQEITSLIPEEVDVTTPQYDIEPPAKSVEAAQAPAQPALIEEALPQTTFQNEILESSTTLSPLESIDTRIKPESMKPVASLATEQAVVKPTTKLPESEEDEASTEVDDVKLSQQTEQSVKEEATTLGVSSEIEIDQSTVSASGASKLPESDWLEEEEQSEREPTATAKPTAAKPLPPWEEPVEDWLPDVVTEQREVSTGKAVEPAFGEVTTEQQLIDQEPLSTDKVLPAQSSTEQQLSVEEKPTTEQVLNIPEQSSTEAEQQLSTQKQAVDEEIQTSTEQREESSTIVQTQPEPAKTVELILNQEKQPESDLGEAIDTTTLSKAESPEVKPTTEILQQVSTDSPAIVKITETEPSEAITDGVAQVSSTLAPSIEAETPSDLSAEKIQPVATTVQSIEEETSSPVTEGVRDEIKEAETPVSSVVTESAQGELESSTSHLEQPTTVSSAQDSLDQDLQTQTPELVPEQPLSKTNLTVALDDGLSGGSATTFSPAEEDDLSTEEAASGIAASSPAATTNIPIEISSQSPSKPDLIHSTEDEEEDEEPRPTTIISSEFKPQTTVDLLSLVTGSMVTTEPAIFDVVPTRLAPATVIAAIEEKATESVDEASVTPEAIVPELSNKTYPQRFSTEQPDIVTEVPTTERAQLFEQSTTLAAEQNDTIYEAIQTVAPPAPSKTNVNALDNRFDETTNDNAAPVTNVPPTQKPVDASPTTLRPDEIPAPLPNRTESAYDSKLNQTAASPMKKPTYPPPPASYDSYGQVSSEYPGGSGSTYTDEEYTDEEEPTVFGPGTCRYGGKLYVSAQQIPRDDPCDFCFCFRSDIICLQQSCPPPISGCHEEPIQGFCCPRYECPVSMALVYNASTSTTTTTTLPPHLIHYAINNTVSKQGCQIQGTTYQKGETVSVASGPCIDCM